MQALNTLGLNKQACTYQFFVAFGQQHYAVHSNHASLIATLKHYFSPWLISQTMFSGSVNIYLFSQRSVNNHFDWQNWPRETGKTGLKEQICDNQEGRWIHKFKTGMVFFQHPAEPFAVGPCELHASQMINFVINQHINYLQQQGGLICHASCLSIGQKGVAIAALSGGGKSTTMLNLMDESEAKFVSNDRLFLFQNDGKVTAHGVAKQPRVNPGTLFNNAKLRFILSEEKQQQVSRMSKQDLWQLEEKYDVMVDSIYGKHAMAAFTPLHHVILLNWSHSSNAESVSVREINLRHKPELVDAIAKSPGPFYQNAAGDFLHSASQPARSRYIDMLAPLKVWEVSGAVDFKQLIVLLKSTLPL